MDNITQQNNTTQQTDDKCIEYPIQNNETNLSKDQVQGLLFEAVRKGNIDEIRQALKLGADINFTNRLLQVAPLHYAVFEKQTSAVKELLEQNADINIQDPFGDTPLHCAVKCQSIDHVKLLLNRGANITIKGYFGYTVLHIAAASGNLEIMNEILNRCANSDINILHRSGMTPLCLAYQNGYIDCMKELLNRMADINIRDIDGNTLLHYKTKNIECIKELLNQRPDINAINNKEETPLFRMVQYDDLICIKLLLDHGANIHIKSFGTPLLHHAVIHSSIAILKELSRHNLDIDSRDDKGNTALYVAILHNKLEHAKLLMQYGANAELANFEGETPKIIATNADIKALFQT